MTTYLSIRQGRGVLDSRGYYRGRFTMAKSVGQGGVFGLGCGGLLFSSNASAQWDGASANWDAARRRADRIRGGRGARGNRGRRHSSVKWYRSGSDFSGRDGRGASTRAQDDGARRRVTRRA